MSDAASNTSQEPRSSTADARSSVGVPAFDVVEVQSPRAQLPPMASLDALIGQSQWAKIVETLAPVGDALPPAYMLVYAVALRELHGDEGATRQADALSIRALSGLLDVREGSPTALLLARRMQRRDWRRAPAPKPRVQIALVVIAVLLGASVGWMFDEYRDRQEALRATRAAINSDCPVLPGQTH